MVSGMGWFTTLLAAPRTTADGLPEQYGDDWALVDVETTGLRPGQNRVIQVAVITLDASGTQTGEFSSLVDPGCDPGPTHIHGITAAHLRGAPQFAEVAPHVAGLLHGRTLVAHNASFDYDFLRHEFIRAGSVLPVQRRLCTLALNRRLGTPSPDMRLGTLAAHYRVPQRRAHDALDDTRVLAGILRASLHAAAPLGLGLPLVTCPPKGQAGGASITLNIPKTACSFASAGRWLPGGPLVQGMKVAVTGDTSLAREELVARGSAAGLNMMSNVSRHTSVLVTNDSGSGSAKADRARAEGVPVIDETSFVSLLGTVQPGVPLEQAPRPVPSQRTPSTTPTAPAPAGPLSGRRVLVLGSDHTATSAARARVVGLGAAAAVNLSGSVTDVLALHGATIDKRWQRITSLGLPLRPASWLDTPDVDERLGGEVGQADALDRSDGLVAHADEIAAALVLARGQAVDLPADGTWTFSASWSSGVGIEVDVIAFVLTADEQVSCDDDFVFYNNPAALDGAVALISDGPSEQTLSVDLDALPAWVHRLTVAAAIDDAEATFGEVGAVALGIGNGGDAAVFAEATLDAATVERTLALVELYRRGDRWRVRPVGQGWTTGLAELALLHGVDVEEKQD